MLFRRVNLSAVRVDGGFALLIVLWVLVLVAFITIHVTATGRTEVRISGNLTGNAAAQAAADGAIYEAIFNLSDPRPDRHWIPDGSLHDLSIGDSQIGVRVENEAGRLNPNLATPALLEGLFRAIGSEPEVAADLAVAISDWVGSARTPRHPDELLAEYRAAGLDYGPPGSPLESVDELLRVRGMTPKLFAALLPHVSLFSPAKPDPAYADPVVASAIAFAEGGVINTRAPIVAAVVANDSPVTVRIEATARGSGNAEATRMAVARVGPFNAAGYALLSWGTPR